MQNDVSFVLRRGIKLAEAAFNLINADEPDCERQEQAVLDMARLLYPISSADHKAPQASYYIGYISYALGMASLDMTGIPREEVITNVCKHFGVAAHFLTIASQMSDYQKDLTPYKAMDRLSYLHLYGIVGKHGEERERAFASRMDSIQNGKTDPQMKTDYWSAFRLRLTAAEAGVATAQKSVAIMYLNGDGIKPSLSQAFRWICKAEGNKEQLHPSEQAEVQGVLDVMTTAMNDSRSHRPQAVVLPFGRPKIAPRSPR